MRVSETTTAILGATHSAASAAEELTGGVRKGIGNVASTLGASTADALTRKGPLSGTGSTAGVLGISVVTLGGASASALTEIYGAIETSTHAVIGATTNASAGAVGHRYGSEAEAAAMQLGGSVQKAGRAALNVASFGAKSLARSSARTAVKSTIKGVGSNMALARSSSGSAAPPAPASPMRSSSGIRQRKRANAEPSVMRPG
jgi:hypothetical protein